MVAPYSVSMKRVTPMKFAQKRNTFVRNNPEYAPFITEHSADDVGSVCLLTDDGKGGVAVTDDGEIRNVFNDSEDIRGKEIIKVAKRYGGDHLDCFDGFLVSLYESVGFEEYDRMAWDDEYAPEGWNYDKYGRPDVVMMRLP